MDVGRDLRRTSLATGRRGGNGRTGVGRRRRDDDRREPSGPPRRIRRLLLRDAAQLVPRAQQRRALRRRGNGSESAAAVPARVVRLDADRVVSVLIDCVRSARRVQPHLDDEGLRILLVTHARISGVGADDVEVRRRPGPCSRGRSAGPRSGGRSKGSSRVRRGAARVPFVGTRDEGCDWCVGRGSGILTRSLSTV